MATATVADQAIAETVERALAKYPQHAARIRRAAELLAIDAVRPLGNDRYSVRSQANATESYLVTLADGKYPTCGCLDFERRGKGCKHQWSAHLFSVATVRFEVLSARQPMPDSSQFSPEQAKRLLFARWMVQQGKIAA